MSKPAAGRSMLSALLASQNKALSPQSPDFDAETIVTQASEPKFDRTTKVAKIGYADQGAKHALFLDEGQAQIQEKSPPSPRNGFSNRKSPLTPQKRTSPGNRYLNPIKNINRPVSSDSANENKPTSLLHAALTQGDGRIPKGKKKGQKSPPKSQRGDCLTIPSEPKSNDGCDNIEGNLIVHKNDILNIPNRTIQNLSTEYNSFLNSNNDPLGMTNFLVLDILGQGTFAQVFHCKNMDTGKVCAVKIVKNKPAYTRQGTIEIDVFKTMMKDSPGADTLDVNVRSGSGENGQEKRRDIKDMMVSLLCYFLHKSHLCLVFELLGQNLYELLKRRQFRGLPLRIVKNVVKQALDGVTELTKRKIVHCDLKPENILVVSNEVTQMMVDSSQISGNKSKKSTEATGHKSGISEDIDGAESTLEKRNAIKLIDFGSACYEGSAGFTYIQSRFYRSPEVLVGVQYDSSIDMWSLGCVAAELFLGLPILPGVHEHDQLGRIQEMIGDVPDWMLDRGKKTLKYYALDEDFKNTDTEKTDWNLKTREEFASSLSETELERYGGAKKLEQPPANRYFKYTKLHDIVMHHGNIKTAADKELLSLFVHFLKGLLNPDPCERWTAYQASSHPFITGGSGIRRLSQDKKPINDLKDVNWSPPWDPTVCRRKLSFKQGVLSKSNRRRHSSTRTKLPQDATSPNTLRVMNMTGAMSLSNLESQLHDQQSPPNVLSEPVVHPRINGASSFQPSASMGAIAYEMPNQYYNTDRSNLNLSLHHHFESAAPADLYSNGMQSIPHQPPMPVVTGPQSYSGVYHTGAMGQIAPRGDLGYALQRPGVDPSLQANNIYMQQNGRIQPSSLGSLVQASSYTDPLDISNHYNNIHPMSLPSIPGHGSMPQDYSMHHGASSYQMAYSDASYNHEQSQTMRRDQNQTYYPYRGASM